MIKVLREHVDSISVEDTLRRTIVWEQPEEEKVDKKDSCEDLVGKSVLGNRPPDDDPLGSILSFF